MKSKNIWLHFKQVFNYFNLKALSNQTALSLRLHGVVKFNKAPRDRNKKCYIFVDIKTSWSLHGVPTAIMAMLRSFHGVLIDNCLRSDRASTTFFALSLRIYGAHTAFSRHSHCPEIVKLCKSAVHTQYKRGKDAAQTPYKRRG
jgi:hypothetical protein